MKLKKIILTLVAIGVVHFLKAQNLMPGFDKYEYLEMMKISARTTLAPQYYNTIAAPSSFSMIYSSPIMGLENHWDMWENKRHSQVVLSIRGTTASSISWLDNFYAAMVSAKGRIQIGKENFFDYELSSSEQAAVHVGWLLSTGYLAQDMLPKIRASYDRGIKDYLVVGHSQGGAIAFLLTAHLYSLRQKGILPSDIRIKTYCSAAPKPGNLYFAYHYEYLTQNGWAYNVVNASDWVPQTPISVQTLNDFALTNPFADIRSILRQQKFPNKVAMKFLYKQLDKPTRQAQRRFERYLGKMISKSVQKHLPGFVAPDYFPSNDYARCGNTILLQGDESYKKIYPDSQSDFFVHHFHAPYMFLAERFKN